MNNKQEHYNNFDFNTFFIRIFFIRMMNNKNWQKIKNTLVNNNAKLTIYLMKNLPEVV